MNAVTSTEKSGCVHSQESKESGFKLIQDPGEGNH